MRRKHHYAVLIENEVARNASGQTRADVTGGLEPNGRVIVGLQRRGAKVDVTGNLAGIRAPASGPSPEGSPVQDDGLPRNGAEADRTPSRLNAPSANEFTDPRESGQLRS